MGGEIHCGGADTEYRPRTYKPWISERTLQLSREKVVAWRKGKEDLSRSLSKVLRQSRRKDRKERIQELAKEVEWRLVRGNSLGAYQILRH